jgi:hypothetical protein
MSRSQGDRNFAARQPPAAQTGSRSNAGVAGLILAEFVSFATDTLSFSSYVPLGFMQGIFTIPLLTAWTAVRAAISVPHASMAKETAVSKAVP